MNSRSRFTIALALAIPMLLGAPAPAGENPPPIETVLRDTMAAEKVPGIVWATLTPAGDRVGALGVRNAVTAAPLVSDDKVHVGSVTKSLIALGILRLVSLGRLSLDTPVEQVLRDIRFDNPWRADRPVTVRHLLDHTAGLEDARLWHILSTRNTPDMPLREAVMTDPTVLRVRTPPGDLMSYSNLGFTLAGMVIEQVTGERYEVWLDRELLRPLGMQDSRFAFTTQAGAAPDPRLAWGHLDDGTPVAAVPTAVRPAAQLTTTAADMIRLMRFMLGDGAVSGQPLIDAALLRQMGRPSGTLAAQAGLETGYALGLFQRDRGGQIGFCHQGDTVGYHALFCLYPADQKAFFLALNRDGDGVNLARFHNALMAATAPAARQPDPAPPDRQDMASFAGTYAPVVSRFGIERYADLLDGGVRLEWRDGTLLLRRGGRPPVALTALDGHRLRAADRVAVSHVLTTQAGRPWLLDDQRAFERVSAVSQLLRWCNLWLGLAGLAFLLIAMPALALRGHRRWLEPGLLGLLAFLPAGLLLYRTPFLAWGDLSLASVLLAVVTGLLPLAMLAHGYRVWRLRPLFWQLDLIAIGAVLQWLAVLGAYGLLPLRLWQ